MENSGISIETYLRELKNLNNNTVVGDGIITRFDELKKTISCNSYLIQFEIKKEHKPLAPDAYIKFVGKMKNNKLYIYEYFTADTKEHYDSIVSDIKITCKKLDKMSQTTLSKNKKIPFLLNVAVINIGHIIHTISDDFLSKLPKKSVMIDINKNIEFDIIKALELLIKYKNPSALCIICEDDPNIVLGTCGIDLVKYLNTNYNLLPALLVLRNKNFGTSFEKYTNSVFDSISEMESFLEKTHQMSKEQLETYSSTLKKLINNEIVRHRKNIKNITAITNVINSKTNAVDRNLIYKKIIECINEKRRLYYALVNKILI